LICLNLSTVPIEVLPSMFTTLGYKELLGIVFLLTVKMPVVDPATYISLPLVSIVSSLGILLP
jgi:hypothetical protein